MDTFLQFMVLGLGSGGAYAIASLGVLQIYKGSGVLNLAHGAVAYLAAAIFISTWRDADWPLVPAMALAIISSAVFGLLVEALVMRPLRGAAPLVRMTATLGVFAIVQQGVPLTFGDELTRAPVGTFYPTGTFEVSGVTVGYDRLLLVGLAVALGTGLWLLASRTRYGISTTAVAENPLVASTMGVVPGVVAAVNWSLGCALAGAAGVLLLPVIGIVQAPPLLFLVIPALAAAMIGRFSSFPFTIAGGIALGVGESLLVKYQADIFPDQVATGWPKALPFLVIVALLVSRGTPFPTRVEAAAELPEVRPSGISLPVALGSVVLAVGLVTQASDALAGRVSSSAGLAIVAVSLVVVVGFAGQTSLAQMALAGLGALIAARISDGMGLPFVLILVVTPILAALAGAIVALPSLRTRGPTLAIATLGVGIAIETVVLSNGILTKGGFSGTPIERPTLFGYPVDNINHPQRYAAVAVAALGLICCAVAVLRSSALGRRLLAVRGGERAAASLGVSLTHSKVAAFAISSAVASIGGIILGFRGDTVTYSQFGLLPSLNLLVFSLIGGIGFVLGPVVGSLGAPNGIVSYLFNDISTLQRWLVIGSGVVLIGTLITYPRGVVGSIAARRKKRKTHEPEVAPDRTRGHECRDGPAALSVDDLSVHYGPVAALAGLSLRVEPGEIVGLIGPNGAGKTTALDAIFGFTPADAGSVSVSGIDVTSRPAFKRARAGMTRSFQHLELFDDLTVAENLAVGRESDRARLSLRPAPPLVPQAVVDAAAAAELDLSARPPELAQGPRRYLGVLRALSAEPAVVLLDEPAAGLDQASTKELGSLLRTTADRTGVGFLLVDHDMDLIAATCDRVVALDFGSVIFEGTAAEVATSAAVAASYVGVEIDADGDGASIDVGAPTL